MNCNLPQATGKAIETKPRITGEKIKIRAQIETLKSINKQLE